MVIFIVIIAVIILGYNFRPLRNTKIYKWVYPFLNRFFFVKSLLRGLEIGGIIISIVGLIHSYNESKDASEKSQETLELSKDANFFAKQSSEESKRMAQQNIELLNSISNATSNSRTGIDSFTIKIGIVNKQLNELAANLNSLDNISSSQLKNLKTIDENIRQQLKIIETQDSISRADLSKQPKIIFFVECEYEKKSFTIVAKNIGDAKAHLSYTYEWKTNLMFCQKK